MLPSRIFEKNAVIMFHAQAKFIYPWCIIKKSRPLLGTFDGCYISFQIHYVSRDMLYRLCIYKMTQMIDRNNVDESFYETFRYATMSSTNRKIHKQSLYLIVHAIVRI